MGVRWGWSVSMTITSARAPSRSTPSSFGQAEGGRAPAGWHRPTTSWAGAAVGSRREALGQLGAGVHLAEQVQVVVGGAAVGAQAHLDPGGQHFGAAARRRWPASCWTPGSGSPGPRLRPVARSRAWARSTPWSIHRRPLTSPSSSSTARGRACPRASARPRRSRPGSRPGGYSGPRRCRPLICPGPLHERNASRCTGCGASPRAVMRGCVGHRLGDELPGHLVAKPSAMSP